MKITNDEEATRALDLMYGSQDEAVEAMTALVAYDGNPYDVYEVDTVSFNSGRGFIILWGDLDEELETEMMDDLRRHNARKVIWNPMFQVVGELTYDIDTDHLHGCDKPVAACPQCSEYFQMKKG